MAKLLTTMVIYLFLEVGEASHTPTCESGMLVFEQSCYLRVTDETNLRSAKAACEAMDFHLVFIESSHEQQFVQTIVGSQDLWIGLHTDADGELAWMDGTKATYNNVAIVNEGGECFRFKQSDGKWYDRACELKYGYICEGVPVPSTLKPTSVSSTWSGTSDSTPQFATTISIAQSTAPSESGAASPRSFADPDVFLFSDCSQHIITTNLTCRSGLVISVVSGMCIRQDTCHRPSDVTIITCKANRFDKYRKRCDRSTSCELTCKGAPRICNGPFKYMTASYRCVNLSAETTEDHASTNSIGTISELIEPTNALTTHGDTTVDATRHVATQTAMSGSEAYSYGSTQHVDTAKNITSTRDVSTQPANNIRDGPLPLDEVLATCFDNATQGEANVKPYRPLTFSTPSVNGQPQLTVNFKSASLASKPVKLAIAAFQEPNEDCHTDSSSSGSSGAEDGTGNKTSEHRQSSASELALGSVVNVTVYCFNGSPMQLRDGEYVDVVFPAVIDFDKEVPVCTSMKGVDSKWQWTTDGCRVVYANYTHVTCRCDHLSAIALQRGPKKHRLEGVHAVATYYLELTLGAVSIICLLVMLLVYLTMGVYGSQLTKVQLNIVISIGSAQILFMAGIDATGNLFVCAGIAAILQYLFTAYASWLVVQTLMFLNTCYIHGKASIPPLILIPPKSGGLEPVKLTKIFLGTWGASLLKVGILYKQTPHGFGTPESCWLVKSELPYKIFIAYVCLSLLVNIILVIVTTVFLFKMERVSRTREDVEYEDWSDELKENIRLCLLSSIILSSVLVLTWVFYTIQETQTWIGLEYLFLAFNMSQGLLVFIAYCLLNPHVRSLLSRSLGGSTPTDHKENKKSK